MRLLIRNFTDRSITLGFDKNNKAPHHEVEAAQTITVAIPRWCSRAYLTPAGAKQAAELASANSFAVPIGARRRWRSITSKPDAEAWQMYSVKTKGQQSLLILPRRNMATFLSEMPDSLSLASLTLPGTHESASLYGWPISQCQSSSTPLAVQLDSGIRAIDIRLAVKDSKLIAYHGIASQKTPFQEILATVHAFLTSPLTQRETVIMSIKQEDFAVTPPPDFSALVHQEILDGPGGIGLWFLDNRIPTLGEVRGKVIMFSRFGGDGSGWDRGLEGLGIHPSTWPDNSQDGFEWTCKDTLVRTRDWYNIATFLSIPEKFTSATSILTANTDATAPPTLAISYLSASSFPLALPEFVAKGLGLPSAGMGFKGVNDLMAEWLLRLLDSGGGDGGANGGEPRVRGWVMMDFYDYPNDSLAPLLVECNYRGRKAGQEGWI